MLSFRGQVETNLNKGLMDNKPAFGCYKQPCFSGSQTLVMNAARKTGQLLDEVVLSSAKTSSGSNVLNKIISAKNIVVTNFKRAVAFCAATITGASIVATNMGDDIRPKIRSKVKFRPVKILKDAGKQGVSKVRDLFKPDHQGNKITDLVNPLIDGASQTTGVDIIGSAKQMTMNKIKHQASSKIAAV